MNPLRKRIIFLALLCSSTICTAQEAFFPLVGLTTLPRPATSQDVVWADLISNGCAAFDPWTFQTTSVGQSVRLTHKVDYICGVPQAGFHVGFPLGRFAPGTYTLTYEPTDYYGYPYAVQSVEFTVEANAIPTLSHTFTRFLLAATILITGLCGLTMRSS